MVRRLFAVGAAITLILSFSVVSFATQFDFGFPYFTRVRLRQGSTDLIPITSWDSNDPRFIGSYSKSFSNSTSGNLQFYLYGNNYSNYSCRTISGGTYSIDGYFDFSSSSDVTGTAFGVPELVISDSNNSFVQDFDVVSYDYVLVNGTNNKRIHYSFVFNVNQTVEDYSSIRFTVPVTGSYSCIGWSVYTGAVDIVWNNVNLGDSESVNYVQDTNVFSRLFNIIASGIGRIVDAVKDDSDAQQAAQSADHQAIAEASSEISAVETYESTVSGRIDDSIDDLQGEGFLTPPSGFGSSVGVIGYVFTSFYNCLGTYKFIVIVPLVLGLVLLLVGRGGRALRKDN